MKPQKRDMGMEGVRQLRWRHPRHLRVLRNELCLGECFRKFMSLAFISFHLFKSHFCPHAAATRAEQSVYTENICAESISWMRLCREFLELKERYQNFICEFFTSRTLQNKHPSAYCVTLPCDVSSFSSFFLSEFFT